MRKQWLCFHASTTTVAAPGSGKFTHANGDYFVGTFEAGARSRGRLVSANGDQEYNGR